MLSLRVQNLQTTSKNKQGGSKQGRSNNKKGSVKNLPNVAGFEHDYLSATDPEDYADRISIKNLSESDRKAHLLRLWRTCYNCTFGVAMMLS